MAKNIDHFSEAVVQAIETQRQAGDYVSDEQREAIIQDIIASQRIEGIEVSYEMVSEVIDEVLSEPVPTLK
jgi:hypothetical protein